MTDKLQQNAAEAASGEARRTPIKDETSPVTQPEQTGGDEKVNEHLRIIASHAEKLASECRLNPTAYIREIRESIEALRTAKPAA